MAKWTLKILSIQGDDLVTRVMDYDGQDGEVVRVSFDWLSGEVPASENWAVGSEVALRGFGDFARRCKVGESLVVEAREPAEPDLNVSYVGR